MQIKQSLLGAMRQNSPFVRAIASTVIITFCSLILSPTAQAVKQEYNQYQQEQRIKAIENSPDALFSRTLQSIKENIHFAEQSQSKFLSQAGSAFHTRVDLDNAIAGGKLIVPKDVDEALNKAKELHKQVPALKEEIIQSLAASREELRAKELPDEIIARHDEFVARFDERFARYTELMDTVNEAEKPNEKIEAVEALNAFMSEQQFKRSQQPFDPNNLPSQTLKPNPDIKPRTTKNEYSLSGLYDLPALQVAALGDFTYGNLNDADNPAYLAESDEVVLSDAIHAKAEELEYDPVKIYHWVRNSTDWLPSWGAIQNADLTLSARRGNSMDIASLTLALLRASQIPSRYVHGTIEIPADEFMNWAGGFSDINAAINYASSAGIPTTGIISGGTIQTVRIEHVWVEAAIDYLPSRGAKNYDADTWLSMDPSFKQFEFLEGLDVLAISGLDAEQLANDFIASGSMNEAEGWATGFDPTILQNAMDQAQTQLEDYINTNLNDPTVGEVIGGRKTIVKEYPVLPSSLPNRIVTEGARYDKLPTSLQQRVSYGFGVDILGDPLISSTLPFSKVNNEKITLSFRPATQADEDALASLLPEGEITDISQLPSSIPSYLITVIPELKVKGEVVQSGMGMSLGEELDFVTQVRLAGNRIQAPRTYKVIAGSFLAVSATSGSVATSSLENTQSRLESTKAILETGDPNQIGNLGREDILGDMFQAGVLGYYGQAIALSNLMGLQSNAHQNILAGTGTVGYEPNVSYFFGFPRAIESGGVAFDIPYLQASAVGDGDIEKQKLFNLQTGALMSALEHITPEQMFAEEDPNAAQPNAISAVKALQIASESGQRIYQITAANQSQTLPSIHHDPATMSEIHAALNAGKEVTTHTDAVSVPGWSGAGYIIVDPETGAGAYKIAGGGNGGHLDAAAYVALVFTLKIDYSVALLENAAVTGPLIRALQRVSVFFTGAAVLVSALQTAAECQQVGAQAIILLSAAISVLVAFSVFFLTLAINPILAFMVQAAVGFALDRALNSLKGTELCNIP